MKIIHCADIHLGSSLSSLPKGKIKDIRKQEIRLAFSNMLNYAKDNGIKIIMLSGDVFDSNSPNDKDKKFFYDAIRSNKEITFLYLKGNHDIEASYVEECDNLILFNNKWSKYSFDNVDIYGIELDSTNNTSLYSSLNLDKNRINIVMMHGDIVNKGKDYINLAKLANKNIDYLALGHIHSFQVNKIDERGEAIYSGCLEGRGFDETGEKGFIILDIDKSISFQFVKNSRREIIEKRIDLSKSTTFYEACEIVKSNIKDLNSNSIAKVILEGKVSFDVDNIENDLECIANEYFFYSKVVSELKRKIDISEYEKDVSLKGEFIRLVLSKNDLSQEEKDEIINVGMKLFNKEELEK